MVGIEDLANNVGPGDSGQKAQQQQREREQAVEQMKHEILSRALSQDARARLNTIKTTKPEKATQIEEYIVRMAQSGQLPAMMSEEQLVGILSRLSSAAESHGQSGGVKVKFDRRRAALDSDSD